MKGIIDTHAHICDPVFDSDRPAVLKKAKETGVSCIIAVAENLADAEKNLALSDENPILRPAAGLFPSILDPEQAAGMADFIQCHAGRIAAIGEVGLDYWKVQEESERELQREILRGFIRLSRQLDLPLNVHSRSAGRHTIEFLLKHSAQKVQLHAFDGKASLVLPAVEAGYFFSIPPSVVRSVQKQKLAKALPLTHILIETDSPVLGPDPKVRNEPANALIAVKEVARLKGFHEEEILEAAINNTRRLYGNTAG